MRSPAVREVGVPTPRLVLAGLATAALALLVVVASSGPVALLSPGTGTAGAGPVPPRPSPVSETTTSTGSGPSIDPSTLPDLPTYLVDLLRGLFWLLAVAVLLAVGMAVWRAFPRLRRTEVVTHPATVLPEVPEQLVDLEGRRIALLRKGNPRNAIVACWVDLEDAAAEAGLPRRESETAAEYTVRVLHTWDVDIRALAELADLYREARFSRHDLGEHHREAAIAALASVQAHLVDVHDAVGGPR